MDTSVEFIPVSESPVGAVMVVPRSEFSTFVMTLWPAPNSRSSERMDVICGSVSPEVLAPKTTPPDVAPMEVEY